MATCARLKIEPDFSHRKSNAAIDGQFMNSFKNEDLNIIGLPSLIMIESSWLSFADTVRCQKIKKNKYQQLKQKFKSMSVNMS